MNLVTNNKKIKAVIFDMDGVLIDAKDWHYDALNKALEIFGARIELTEHLSTFDGLPTKRKLELLSESGRIPFKLHDLISELKQKYTEQLTNINCKPKFLHQYALSKLKEEGYLLAVASNSVMSTIKNMMRLSLLENYFDFFLSNEDVIKPKPDPEIYLKAMNKLGLKSEEVVIVEDNINGIEAAKASGGNVLEVKNTEEVNYKNIIEFINNCNKKC